MHVPFCSIKCFYCDFTAFSGQGSRAGRYLEAVDVEARGRGPFSPETLYIGGGTPTELSAPELSGLLERLLRRYPSLERAVEATAEANPETATPDRLEALRAGGVDRLSLGLQASQDRLLAAIGRRHSWRDFLAAYRSAASLGFALSVDLMVGLPGQGMEDVRETLSRALELDPGHLSVYDLKVEDRTLFSKRGVRWDEAFGREAMAEVRRTLAEAGFRHYEISNFARLGRESLHNSNYWLGGSYLGLGCGASGFTGGVRYSNADRLEAYLSRVEEGGPPTESEERLEGKEKAGESLLLGLRLLDGYRPSEEAVRFFGEELSGLREKGLVERTGDGRLRLTEEGVFLGDVVFREFVPPFNGDNG